MDMRIDMRVTNNEQQLVTDIVKLMVRINNHARSHFEHKIETNYDKKKFEVEMKYFNEWFGEC